MQFRERARTPQAEFQRTSEQARLVTVPVLVVIAIAVVGVAAGAAWATLGTVERTVSGTGILTREPGLTPVQSPVAGQVTLAVEQGDPVEAGQTIATVDADPTSDDDPLVVAAPVSGRVATVPTVTGAIVELGSRLAILEPESGALAAVIYVDALRGPEIELGSEAIVWPLGFSPADEGAVIGSVVDVEEFPATIEQLENTLFVGSLVVQLAQSPVVAVTVELGDGELDWTLADQSSASADPGTVIEARVQISSERPYQVLIGG